MKWIVTFALFLASSSAAFSQVVYTQLLLGKCTDRSFTAAALDSGDVTQHSIPFPCENAMVEFLDRQYKRVRITFPSTIALGHISGLTFVGVRDYHGHVIRLSSMLFDRTVSLPVTNSSCKLFLAGKSLQSIVCEADRTGATNYRAFVTFAVSPVQSISVDDDDEP